MPVPLTPAQSALLCDKLVQSFAAPQSCTKVAKSLGLNVHASINAWREFVTAQASALAPTVGKALWDRSYGLVEGWEKRLEDNRFLLPRGFKHDVLAAKFSLHPTISKAVVERYGQSLRDEAQTAARIAKESKDRLLHAAIAQVCGDPQDLAVTKDTSYDEVVAAVIARADARKVVHRFVGGIERLLLTKADDSSVVCEAVRGSDRYVLADKSADGAGDRLLVYPMGVAVPVSFPFEWRIVRRKIVSLNLDRFLSALDPGCYVLPFGRNAGQSLWRLWSDDREYLEWLATLPVPDGRNALEARSAAIEFLIRERKAAPKPPPLGQRRVPDTAIPVGFAGLTLPTIERLWLLVTSLADGSKRQVRHVRQTLADYGLTGVHLGHLQRVLESAHASILSEGSGPRLLAVAEGGFANLTQESIIRHAKEGHHA